MRAREKERDIESEREGGQCPWQVLQHICLKYARLQNLNLSTRGQYATVFTSLHSVGHRKSTVSHMHVKEKCNVHASFFK